MARLLASVKVNTYLAGTVLWGLPIARAGSIRYDTGVEQAVAAADASSQPCDHRGHHQPNRVHTPKLGV